jgi:hypothetical protein
VSVGEAQRLRPFIPSDTDSADAAITKLENLRREYATVNSLLQSTYSKEQGYKPSPVRPQSGPVDLHSLPSGGKPKVVNFGDLK